MPACLGTRPVGRAGGPTRVHAGASVCAGRGWVVENPGSTELGVGMSGFSLPHGSPMTLEFNLPGPQVFPVAKWAAKTLLHRVVKKIQTNKT